MKRPRFGLVHSSTGCSTQSFSLVGITGVSLMQNRQVIFRQSLSRWQRILRSLIKLSPRVFAWCRVRWSCAALAVTLVVLTQIKVARETVRLELKAAAYVWKRSKLEARDDDPERARRLARIRLLIENRRPDELILFADELDIDLLPKVGYQWMLRGAQLEVWTPGKNQKHYLAGALDPATGQT